MFSKAKLIFEVDKFVAVDVCNDNTGFVTANVRLDIFGDACLVSVDTYVLKLNNSL